jgi:hypothetical protein
MLSLKSSSPKYPQPACTHDPDDFSQPAINRGQRIINYKFTEVEQKLVEALNSLIDAVENIPGCDKAKIDAASNAIAVAEEFRSKIAETRPPGCEVG